jgi:hypothetical protein
MREEGCPNPMTGETGETIECFNCGRSNPEWAQVCRSCGVVLRHGTERIVPAGRYPTDRDSLMSIGAVVATILAALLIGLFVSSLNPTDPTVGVGGTPSPTPTPSPTESPSAEPSVAASVAPSVAATPPPLPGTLAFGTTIDANRNVVDPTDTFTPGMDFAYSVTMPATFGAAQIQNEIVRIQDGAEQIVLERQAVPVDPAATSYGYVIGDATGFIGELGGPGDYIWRVYINDQLVAQGPFHYVET